MMGWNDMGKETNKVNPKITIWIGNGWRTTNFIQGTLFPPGIVETHMCQNLMTNETKEHELQVRM